MSLVPLPAWVSKMNAEEAYRVTHVKSKVVSMSFYRVRCKLGYGSVMMELECGHQVGRKQSEAKNVVPGHSMVRCHQCTSALSGDSRQEGKK